MSELKRCPFCGGEVRFVKTGCSSRGKIGHLYCDGCKESFFKNDRWHTESELYEKWNTRKPLERVIARLEEYANDLKEDWDKYDNEDDFGGYCAVSRAIEIIKQEMIDISFDTNNATQNSSETQHTATNCCNMEHIKQRFERVM